MGCEQYQEAISATALGAETGAEVQAFRLHLELCEGCRRELARRREFLASVDRQLLTQLEAAPSTDFNARLRRRIAGESKQVPWPRLRWIPVFAGATALAVLLAGAYLRKMRDVRDVLAPPAVLSTPLSTVQVQAVVAPEANETGDGVHRVSRHRADLRATFALHEVGVVSRSPLPTEIRINKQESQSLDALVRAVATEQVETASLIAAPPGIDQSLEASALKFPPITFTPLDPGLAAPNDRN
jgi:hypothetical protein